MNFLLRQSLNNKLIVSTISSLTSSSYIFLLSLRSTNLKHIAIAAKPMKTNLHVTTNMRTSVSRSSVCCSSVENF